MNTLTTEELSKRLESGPLPLFDVRGDVEYEKGHIPGAKTAPLGSLVFRVACVMNPDSDRLRSVYCYEGGLRGWRAAGLSVVPSPSVRVHTQGPVIECRPLIVDRETAYGGAFREEPADVEGAGG